MERKTWALAAMAIAMTAGVATASTFPTNANGAYSANVVRRIDSTGTFTTTIADYNPVAVYSQEQAKTYGAIDGGYSYDQWDIGGTSNPSASAGFDITLDKTYSLKEFDVRYGGYVPNGYTIQTSTTGFDNLTTVVSGSAPGASSNKVDVLATPVLAKYIRYVWTGSGAYVQLQEFHAYADAATNPFPITTDGGYDIIASLANPATATTDLTPGNWSDSVAQATDLNENTYLRGKGTGDATFQVDLGSVQNLDAFSLGFYPSQTWSTGVKIELSDSPTSGFSTVYSTTSGVGNGGSVIIPITATQGRYVRITDYNGNGGTMSDLQVFGSPTPEPASLSLLAMGGASVLLRRRRR